jgi:hypothetical protein
MNGALLRNLNRTNRATAVGNEIISAIRASSAKAPNIDLVNASRTQFHKHRILCVDDEIIPLAATGQSALPHPKDVEHPKGWRRIESSGCIGNHFEAVHSDESIG